MGPQHRANRQQGFVGNRNAWRQQQGLQQRGAWQQSNPGLRQQGNMGPKQRANRRQAFARNRNAWQQQRWSQHPQARGQRQHSRNNQAMVKAYARWQRNAGRVDGIGARPFASRRNQSRAHRQKGRYACALQDQARPNCFRWGPQAYNNQHQGPQRHARFQDRRSWSRRPWTRNAARAQHSPARCPQPARCADQRCIAAPWLFQ